MSASAFPLIRSLFILNPFLIGSCAPPHEFESRTKTLGLDEMLNEASEIYLVEVKQAVFLSPPGVTQLADGSPILVRMVRVNAGIVGAIKGSQDGGAPITFQYLEWADSGGSFPEGLELIGPPKKLLVMLRKDARDLRLVRDVFRSSIRLNSISSDDFKALPSEIVGKVTHLVLLNAIRRNGSERIEALRASLKTICSIDSEPSLKATLLSLMRLYSVPEAGHKPLLETLTCKFFKPL